MLLKILRKDYLRKKSISITLFIFVSISALLVASGSNMIVELTHSINALFVKSKAPHFVQMHAGDLNQADMERFALGNKLVDSYQIVEMVNVEGSQLRLGEGAEPESNSVMDHYFVRQNPSFDLLLNMDSQVIQVNQGEIAVPIYYMQQKDLKIGDIVNVASDKFQLELKIVDFVRDVQMNPSIIHSKRFVIHETDLVSLRTNNVGEREYMIEFQLTDLSKLSEFRNAYQSSGLPKLGPSIDVHLFKTLNAISDGILAVVIILVSLLLVIIAILCLRFTILTAIEEDYREIGVMKAIGISQRDIKKIYLLKYVVIAALASIVGYIVSLFLSSLFTGNILLYIGTAPKSIWLHIIPLLAVGLIFVIVVLFCMITLRRFNRISAVEALRAGNVGERPIKRTSLRLHKNKWLNVPVFLALREVFGRFKMYRLLLFVFIISSFIIIVPVNLLTTVQSPQFNTYMGIERSDLRIDLQYSDHITDDYDLMESYLRGDNDIERFSPVFVSQFKVKNNEGILENITVETGDFSLFPLEYVSGSAPVHESEIALSYLNAKELEKKTGDWIKLVVGGEQQTMVVSGIYQDVTNGGRTAKAVLPYNEESVLRYEVSVDLKPGVDIGTKIDEYAKVFDPAKVTDLDGYLAQTLGNTIDQLQLLAIIAIVIALLIAILITALFLKMIVAKDYTQIAIMKSIGFSLKQIRVQYVTRALLVLGIGIIVGTVIANTLGENLAGVFMSSMGASTINFVVNPMQAYINSPLLLMSTVTITALISIISIKHANISEMNAE